MVGLSPGTFALDVGIGAMLGAIPGFRIPGITAGRNSFSAIFKQIVSKLNNGTIGGIRLQTAIKMFLGRSAAANLLPGASAATIAGDVFEGLVPKGDCGCN